MSIQRLCGSSRTQSGIYWTVPLSPFGIPFQDWLSNVIVDPPLAITPEMPIKTQGVSLFEKDGVYHVLDRVGSKNTYVNVADMIEEWAVGGVSRKMPRNLDFSKLTPQSRLLLVHDKAGIENAIEYGQWKCPKNIEGHDCANYDEEFSMCAGLWWEDIVQGEVIKEGSRKVKRTLPATDYLGRMKPDNVKPIYYSAIFASIPCFSIEVIRDKETGAHKKSVELASKSQVKVRVVDE